MTEFIASVQDRAMAEFRFATYRSAKADPRPDTSAVSSPTRVGMIRAIVETPANAPSISGMYRSGVIPQLLSMTAKLMPPLVPAPAHAPAIESSPQATPSVE